MARPRNQAKKPPLVDLAKQFREDFEALKDVVMDHENRVMLLEKAGDEAVRHKVDYSPGSLGGQHP